MKSPYVGLPVEKWEKKTRQLIEEHPLDPGEVFEVAIKVWNDIIETDCPICAWPNTTSCTVLHDVARIMCKLIIVSAVLRSNVSKISEIQTDSVLNRALHFIYAINSFAVKGNAKKQLFWKNQKPRLCCFSQNERRRRGFGR